MVNQNRVLISAAKLHDDMLVSAIPNQWWYIRQATPKPHRGLFASLRNRLFGYPVLIRGVARYTSAVFSGVINSRRLLVAQR